MYYKELVNIKAVTQVFVKASTVGIKKVGIRQNMPFKYIENSRTFYRPNKVKISE